MADKLDNIPYQSFCWVLGTTSFRTAQLNLKIEQQLIMLSELQSQKSIWQWKNNSDLQAEYYNFMQQKEFIKGDAPRKDKDAREKTSGLIDIGLLNDNRELTNAGRSLLELSNDNNFKQDNFFGLDSDSFVYFKQLLKTHLTVDNKFIRPYLVLAKLLKEFDYLSYNEFRYLLPLCIDKHSTEIIIEKVGLLRNNQLTIQDVIYETLINLENYQISLNLLLNNEISEDLICVIGMNRKSRTYDKPYYQLFLALYSVFINKESHKISELYHTIKNIKQRTKWLGFIFKNSNERTVKNLGMDNINENCPFLLCQNKQEFKQTFFKYLHTFKGMATLEDYFDLNRRYFGLTNTIIFEEETVKFDILPKYFFDEVINDLYATAFEKHSDLENNIELSNIHSSLIINKNILFKRIGQDFNMIISSVNQMHSLIGNERYKRFYKILQEKFKKDKLIQLLDYFKNRNDKEIYNMVTDEATISTIFEYVLAIIWYELSDKQGDILKFMNLSLTAELMPKSHATGGYADIIYRYKKSNDYPEHHVLIEATLANDNNQRKMEMEPVSRHLGEYLLKYDRKEDYCIFVSNKLHLNLVSDFLHRKTYLYYSKDLKMVNGMKIIPIDTDYLKALLIKDKKYSDIYQLFNRAYQENSILPHEWNDHIVKQI